jgi:hypothetical protein
MKINFSFNVKFAIILFFPVIYLSFRCLIMINGLEVNYENGRPIGREFKVLVYHEIVSVDSFLLTDNDGVKAFFKTVKGDLVGNKDGYYYEVKKNENNILVSLKNVDGAGEFIYHQRGGEIQPIYSKIIPNGLPFAAFIAAIFILTVINKITTYFKNDK